MKNRNKYVNLATGLAFWALNSQSLFFSLLSIYGLFMIRDFTVKENDGKLKLFTDTLIGFATLRGILGITIIYIQSSFLPFLNIFVNVVLFILSLIVLKASLKYLLTKLKDYELVNVMKKVTNGYYIVIAMDGILILLLLLVVFTLFFPITFLINFISIFLNPTYNAFFGLGLTLVKYFASRSFSRAAMLLANAVQLENRMDI